MLVKCETCKGSGEAVVSCCTGEVVHGDIQMCPECYEHLGEDTCPDCGGSGEIEEGTPLSPTAPDMQLAVEAMIDAHKHGDL